MIRYLSATAKMLLITPYLFCLCVAYMAKNGR